MVGLTVIGVGEWDINGSAGSTGTGEHEGLGWEIKELVMRRVVVH